MAGKNFEITVKVDLRVPAVEKEVLEKLGNAMHRWGKGVVLGRAQQLAPRGTGPLGRRKKRLYESLRWSRFKKTAGGVLKALLPAWFIENGSVNNPQGDPFMSRAIFQSEGDLHREITDIV